MTASERGLAAFARAGESGLIVTAASVVGRADRDLVIGLAGQYKLPAVYPNSRSWIAEV